MNSLTDSISNTLVSEYANVEESYSLLYTTFVDGLENLLDLFLENGVDYLDIISEKINFVRNLKELDGNELARINDVEDELYNTIENKFKSIYNVDIPDYERKNNLSIIYRFFFNGKRDHIINFLINYITIFKKQFLSQYKNKVVKDVTYTQIRNEVEFNNLAYYTLVYFYKEIATSILECDVISISTLFQYSNIGFTEVNVLTELFEDSDQIEEYKKYFDGLTISANVYPLFLTEFRNRLITSLSKLN